MEDTLTTIVDMEWEAFQRVRNTGGRALCQDDRRTFVIMRASQFMAWDEASRASYLHDLTEAEEKGKNLPAQKYAHMMERTAPVEYDRLRLFLPPVSEEAKALIEEIVAVQMRWQRECAAAWPKLAARSRPTAGGEDDMTTSFETYLRGELLTYSPETLRLYAAHIQRLHARGSNMSMQIMENTARMYGYASASAAEAGL